MPMSGIHNNSTCHVCPITLEPMTASIVLDQKHAFDVQAIYRHLLSEAICKGRPSRLWVNPLTNAPIRDIWTPPPVVQRWLRLAGRRREFRLGYHPVVHLIGSGGRRGTLADGVCIPTEAAVLYKSNELSESRQCDIHWPMNHVLLLDTLGQCVISGRSHSSERYITLRNLLYGIPIHFSGDCGCISRGNSKRTRKYLPDSKDEGTDEKQIHSSPVYIGELVMADGCIIQGAFKNGVLHGSGKLSGPGGIFQVRSDCFTNGIIRGSFVMEYFDRDLSRIGTFYRSVGFTYFDKLSRYRKKYIGEFRVLSPNVDSMELTENILSHANASSNQSIHRNSIRSVWGEDSPNGIHFKPITTDCVHSIDGFSTAMFQFPPRDSNDPIKGVLQIGQTQFDADTLQTYRYTWRGPVHCYIQYNPYIGRRFSGYPMVSFRVSSEESLLEGSQGGLSSGILNDSSIAGELKIVPDPPSGTITQEILQNKMKDLFIHANQLATGFFSACADHVWSGYAIGPEYGEIVAVMRKDPPLDSKCGQPQLEVVLPSVDAGPRSQL